MVLKPSKCDSCENIPPPNLFSDRKVWVKELRKCAEKCAPQILWIIDGMEEVLDE